MSFTFFSKMSIPIFSFAEMEITSLPVFSLISLDYLSGTSSGSIFATKREFVKEYRGKGPVLYLREIEKAIKPDDDMVYF